MTIKLIKTDSELLETVGSKIVVNGDEFFYIPFWYKKINDGLYEQITFNNLPQGVIDYINKNRCNDAV